MKFIKKTLLVVFFFFSGFVLQGQPADPQTNPDNPVPITGIEYLLAGGGLLGAYRLLRQKLNRK